MDRPTIFSRTARRRARNRAARSAPEDRWLITRMAEELADRVEAHDAPIARALLIGNDFGPLRDVLGARGTMVFVADPGEHAARTAGGVVCDEERLPFADGVFDLVAAIGTLDTVEDLPGALILIRRVLKPGGLFLGALVGGGSGVALREAVAQIDAPAVARLHPGIDVRDAGNLLARAGLANPVAEVEAVAVRYRTPQRLFADLRANALGNVLAQRHAFSRPQRAQLLAVLPRDADGRITESVAILYLTAHGRGGSSL